jgi:hypothetical protein
LGVALKPNLTIIPILGIPKAQLNSIIIWQKVRSVMLLHHPHHHHHHHHLEPRQTPRKVLQAARRLKDAVARLPEDKRRAIEEEDKILADNARNARESRLNAREAAKRKAIIHEEALLDHDALDLKNDFWSSTLNGDVKRTLRSLCRSTAPQLKED